uniref:Uncharacterized protein n=1 Tax=Arundo donax TaxID=35708 RepID=A0A0A9EFW7_ARUDO
MPKSPLVPNKPLFLGRIQHRRNFYGSETELREQEDSGTDLEWGILVRVNANS